ncbi:MBL fold metallo-hydrolase [Flavivirga jejuensis]|uniref:MBL fold metallo-hydrolase n=1 Tax=Flavivirga jejuensis TaxID=870487 RepID=A0ABT8WN98_9FLAO|nr:MBL fold metallo-hydrolase [Flavivirga jejuensis]MDO5974638.1 MBL fold metallo-hydrolase [Flavivirga jejuensis]
MKSTKTLSTLFIFLITLVAYTQNKEVIIKTHKLTENIYMLEGKGGNIAISIGDDGVFMIDSQFANLTPKITTAIKQLSEKQIKFLANTHHHGDHSGGNANISKLGTNIIAHDNVYKRIKANTKQSKESLPVITFNDKLNLHINNELVIAFHVENAHTDGDSMLYFTENNVLHTGDVYFNGRYPYIDLNSGGSVNGYIEAIKKGLMLLDSESKIVPGHGAISNKAEYESFLTMLQTLKANVLAEIEIGKTENDVANNTKITAKYDALGYGNYFINSERVRRIFYKSLKK